MFDSEPMFVHIITLSFGLIIAYGLLQIVESFRRRREQKKQEAVEARAAQDAPLRSKE